MGGCHVAPVGTRSGVRARGSVHACPVRFQMAQMARARLAGRTRTGEAVARETLSGEKVCRRAAWKALSFVGSRKRRWREMAVSTIIRAEGPSGGSLRKGRGARGGGWVFMWTREINDAADVVKGAGPLGKGSVSKRGDAPVRETVVA